MGAQSELLSDLLQDLQRKTKLDGGRCSVDLVKCRRADIHSGDRIGSGCRRSE